MRLVVINNICRNFEAKYPGGLLVERLWGLRDVAINVDLEVETPHLHRRTETRCLTQEWWRYSPKMCYTELEKNPIKYNLKNIEHDFSFHLHAEAVQGSRPYFPTFWHVWSVVIVIPPTYLGLNNRDQISSRLVTGLGDTGTQNGKSGVSHSLGSSSLQLQQCYALPLLQWLSANKKYFRL